MECLGRYTLFVMTSVILSGGMKMSVEHGMLRGYTCLVMTSVILSDGVKMKSSMECLGIPSAFVHKPSISPSLFILFNLSCASAAFAGITFVTSCGCQFAARFHSFAAGRVYFQVV